MLFGLDTARPAVAAQSLCDGLVEFEYYLSTCPVHRRGRPKAMIVGADSAPDYLAPRPTFSLPPVFGLSTKVVGTR